MTDRMNIAAQFYEGGLPPKDMDAAIHKLGALLWGQQAWADERRAWWERAARAEFRLGAGVTATVRYGARDGLSKRMIAEQEHDAYNITRRGLRAHAGMQCAHCMLTFLKEKCRSSPKQGPHDAITRALVGSGLASQGEDEPHLGPRPLPTAPRTRLAGPERPRRSGRTWCFTTSTPPRHRRLRCLRYEV